MCVFATKAEAVTAPEEGAVCALIEAVLVRICHLVHSGKAYVSVNIGPTEAWISHSSGGAGEMELERLALDTPV